MTLFNSSISSRLPRVDDSKKVLTIYAMMKSLNDVHSKKERSGACPSARVSQKKNFYLPIPVSVVCGQLLCYLPSFFFFECRSLQRCLATLLSLSFRVTVLLSYVFIIPMPDFFLPPDATSFDLKAAP